MVKHGDLYNNEDLMVEKNMGYPILQVCAGTFSKSHLGQLCLAILSTRVISIHSVESSTSFSKINELHSHKLDRNAYNMIHGNFGSDGGRN